MKSLYDNEAYDEIVSRIHTLNPQSPRQWGKMDVSQMLAHVNVAFAFPLSDQPARRSFMGLLMGGMFKSMMYNDKPWKQGTPTGKEFLIRDQRDFEKEKAGLLASMEEFRRRGPGGSGNHPHPFFGRFTSEQWGMLLYKHTDHHLRQFSA